MQSLLHHVWKGKTLWDFDRYLGLDIIWEHENHQVILSQQTYLKQRDWVQTSNRSVDTPMSTTVNLRTAIPNPNNLSLLPITGTLRYQPINHLFKMMFSKNSDHLGPND